LKHIHFIVNPVAGSGHTVINSNLLKKHFEPNLYTVTVKESSYKKHAIQLTQDSIHEGAHIIVACGGDGTINEVASCLVNSPVVLGVLATGSGNGLASNLKIPKDVLKAIKLLKNQNIKHIDVGRFNTKYFFSNAGIGFDARIVKHYAESGQRRLTSYIRASLKSFKDYKHENLVEATVNGKTIFTRHFMIFASNSNELGYKISLTPDASLQDGLLDILLVSKLSKIRTLFFGFLMLFKKQHILKEVESFQTKRVQLKRQEGNTFNSQIDGEFYSLEDETITVSILEKSLKVIA
jgi:diacylglycerol kinase (ATP)